MCYIEFSYLLDDRVPLLGLFLQACNILSVFVDVVAVKGDVRVLIEFPADMVIVDGNFGFAE